MHRSKMEIFRKAALERLASPEQLDQLMQVTTPKGWLALATIGVLFTAALVWSMVASIPEHVSGSGLMLPGDDIIEVVAQGAGDLAELYVEIGDTVTEGRVVARLLRPELSRDVELARAHVADLERRAREVESSIRQDMRLQVAVLARGEERAAQSIRGTEAMLDVLREEIDTLEDLAARGQVERATLLKTLERYRDGIERIRLEEHELSRFRAAMRRIESAHGEALDLARTDLSVARRELAHLEARLHAESYVRAPKTGEVLALFARPGDPLERGQPIMTIGRAGGSAQHVEIVFFVPSPRGAAVRPGMEVRIAPETVRPEEYGYLLGRVQYVSALPVTPERMHRVLKHSGLVEALYRGQLLYEVRAEPIPDPTNPSLYRWTSSNGPPSAIKGGTLATGHVVVDRRRPIFWVLPQLRAPLTGSRSREGEGTLGLAR